MLLLEKIINKKRGKVSMQIKKRIEELILIIIVLFNIAVIFNMLPPDLLYIKNIMSWATMGYLFYIASPTWIFFGNKHRHIDFLIIMSFFIMIFKNLISTIISIEGGTLLVGVSEYLENNAVLVSNYFTTLGLKLGIISLILIAIYITLKVEVLLS